MTLPLDRQNGYRAQYRAIRPEWRPATEVYEAAIRANLKPGMRVLDLGCGRGGVLEQLGEMVTYPLGCDPDLESLRQSRLPTLPRAQALADAIPLRAESIDLVVCSWVLEHLPNPARVFAEIFRILAPGGSFLFLTPNGVSVVALLNRILRPLQQTLVPRLYGRAEADTFPVHYRANTLQQVSHLATEAGFHEPTIWRIADPTYLAFNPLLFRFSMALAQTTPPVHLVGVLTKGG